MTSTNLVSTSFLYLVALLIILISGIFGGALARIYTIEFQKRGLPHMHLLIFLHASARITTPAHVDQIVSAEFPDPTTCPILFQTILSTMTHGPCSAKCMVNGKCSKGFPKEFQESTTMDESGYPKYRRRNDGKSYEHHGHHF